MTTLRSQPPAQNPLKDALAAQRTLFARSAWFSIANGVLFLAPQWFMFEVYGRVLNSRNANTLLMLLIMVIGVYVVMELIELVRARILNQAAEAVDLQLRERIFNAAFDPAVRHVPGGGIQMFGDLRTIRDFISSPAVTAVLDLPAALLYMVLLAIISPWLGIAAFAGALTLAALAWATERRTMPLLTDANKASIAAQGFAGSALKNAQVIESMGMVGAIRQRWLGRHRLFLSRQSEASEYAGLNAAGAKLVQTMQGSILLGLACWLFLHHNLLGGDGMMLMASILGARALTPLAQLVSHWRTVVNVRDAAKRLKGMLALQVPRQPGMPLPRPRGLLQAEAVVATAGPGQGAILKGVSFTVQPGEMVVVVGPSGAGKTTLARTLVGLWPSSGGKVRLDGADVFNWDKDELGRHLGYVPQTVELFEGTVAENIARFGDVDRDKVQAAAQLTGLHATIEALPQGYDTHIGDDGAMLSGGQRQRMALARAVYGDPQLLVLDEPNSSLDEAGDADLLKLFQTAKARGATVIVISHRTSVLPAADKMLVLADGAVAAFGPRDEILGALKKAREQQAAAASSGPRGGVPARPAPGGAA